MLFLLGGQDKKARKAETQKSENHDRVKDLFLNGKFPVVTTDLMEGKRICKVLGLVCCRGYDSEEAFFGMASRAVNKGAHAIVGYCENIAFHPDGSKFFSCFGTAVMLDWEQEEKYGAAALRETPIRMMPPAHRDESAPERVPYAPRSGSSAMAERAERQPLAAPPRGESMPYERPPRLNQADSSERAPRLNARVIDDDDDLDALPPLRPVGAPPSWQR